MTPEPMREGAPAAYTPFGRSRKVELRRTLALLSLSSVAYSNASAVRIPARKETPHG
jgi:hypothetical protein